MVDAQRRKELKTQYAQTKPEAGVYRITHAATGTTIVRSSANLASARNRFDFAVAQKSAGALDQSLKRDVLAHGFDALAFEVLEAIQPAEDATPEQIAADLKVLEQLWREQVTDLSRG
jgi:hypothetical protein